MTSINCYNVTTNTNMKVLSRFKTSTLNVDNFLRVYNETAIDLFSCYRTVPSAI